MTNERPVPCISRVSYNNGQVLIDQDVALWLIAERDWQIRELTIDRDETERERAKAVERERLEARRADRYYRGLSTGWFRTMEPEFAADRGFPNAPAEGAKHRAEDGSFWRFTGALWEIHEYAPGDVVALIRERDEAQAEWECAGSDRRLVADVLGVDCHIDAILPAIAQLRASVDELAGDAGKYAAEANRLASLLDRIGAIVGHIGKGVDGLPESVARAVVGDRMPAPDRMNLNHGDFVRDWLGQIDDEQLGERPDLPTEQQDRHLAARRGEIARDAVLNTIERIERAAADADADEKLIGRVATLCESSVAEVLGHLGITTTATANVDYRESARHLLTAAGVLKDGAA